MVLITAWLRPGHPSLGGDYKPLTVYGGFLGQSTGCLNICISLLVTEHILIFSRSINWMVNGGLMDG